MKAKQVPETAASGEIKVIVKYIGAALRPYQVESGTRSIFQAHHQVGPELQEFNLIFIVSIVYLSVGKAGRNPSLFAGGVSLFVPLFPGG